MNQDDLVKCPLCGGFTPADKPELRKALHDPQIRQQVEEYVAKLLLPSPGELAGVVTGQPQRLDFNKDVHKWNPAVPLWQRSPKE